MRELGLIFVLLLVFIIPMTIAEHITPTINVEGEIMHIINPYEYVNWKEDLHVCSTTHIHMTTQEQLDNAFMGGLRHFAISNYYPSTPYYYLDKIREQQFKISIEHSIVVNGHLKKGPFDWNKIIMDSSKGWFDELDSEVKKIYHSSLEIIYLKKFHQTLLFLRMPNIMLLQILNRT